MNKDELIAHGAITVVAYGDSVTHGALGPGVIDFEGVYWNRLRKKLNAVRNYVPINVINSGIGGTSATSSLPRLERDVLSHHPDLVIVCFGLNDVGGPYEPYIASLRTIFARCTESGAEVIFLTPNMMNTYVADDAAEGVKEYAKLTAERQTNGTLDKYIAGAVELANELGVTVCDCYGEWKKLYESGVDVTKLLANRVNHPISEMHELFANKLFETIMSGGEFIAKEPSATMANGSK